MQIAQYQGTIFREKMTGHARQHSALSRAKMAERIEMPCGLLTRVSPRKHLLGGNWMDIDATWRIPVNRPCAATMRPFAKLIRALVHYNNGTELYALSSCNLSELECGPMPNVMAALRNIGGALCESSVIPFLVPRRKL